MAFGRLASSKVDAPMSEINVTPMVDVMLVLLVIFILTAPLMTSAIRLDLPQAEGGEAGASPQAVSLVVDAQGTVYLADKPITPEALRLRLAEAAKRNAPPGHSGIGTTLTANLLTMAAMRANLAEVILRVK